MQEQSPEKIKTTRKHIVSMRAKGNNEQNKDAYAYGGHQDTITREPNIQ